jgi:phage gpG-like protein
MPITLDEVSKEVRLDLPDLPAPVERSIKEEVAEFIISSVLEYVNDGRSPVTGQQFKQLSKDYADEEKGGRRTPNLDLEGDMLNSLTWKNTENGIKVGIFDESQTPKAYNHNVGDTLPKRQFIPNGRQRFVGIIEDGVNQIIKERLREEVRGEFEPRRAPRRSPSQPVTAEPAPVSTQGVPFNIFSDEDTITNIVRGVLRGES